MRTNEKEQKVKTSNIRTTSSCSLDKYFYNRIYEYNSLLGGSYGNKMYSTRIKRVTK